MSLEFIVYKVKEEGKLMSSSKIAHYWDIKHLNKAYKISIKESLVSNKFRIFINERKVKEMIATEREKRKGFKFKHKTMEITLKKISNKRYSFTVNGEKFIKGHKKYENVMNLLTKDKKREISTKLIQDKKNTEFDPNFENDKKRFEDFKKNSDKKKENLKEGKKEQERDVYDYEAMDDDFLNFGDFRSVKTIDLSEKKYESEKNQVFCEDSSFDDRESFKSNSDFRKKNESPMFFSNKNIGFKNNGGFDDKNKNFGNDSGIVFKKKKSGNYNNGFENKYNFNGKKNGKMINSEKVISNNNRNKNIYNDPLTDENFLNFDAFDFKSAREIINKNKNGLQKNSNSMYFKQNDNSNNFRQNDNSNNFNLIKKKQKETILISEQEEVNFL